MSGTSEAPRAPRRFDHVPSEDEMMQLAKSWRPYRSLAVSYLWLILAHLVPRA